MKKTLLFVSLALIMNCTGEKSSGPENPNGMGGSSVGNGMTSKYRNVAMNVSFEYPSKWSLVETSPHRFYLDDTKIVSNSQRVSRIEFALLSELDGHHFTSLTDLENYLKMEFPQTKWKPSKLVNKEGFWFEEGNMSLRWGQYYLLDENFNVIFIDFKAFNESDGLAVIQSIVKQLSIDYMAPKILSVRFDKTQAKPGETVTLTVVAEDELSSINPDSFAEPFYVIGCGNGQEGSALGYETTTRNSDWDRHVLDCAYPISSGFKMITPTVFEYRFTIPKFAPPGIIQLQTLHVSDIKGNTNRIYLTPRWYDKYDWGYGIEVAEFEVINESGFVPDVDAPVLESFYFQKSKLFSDDPQQRLYFKITDRSPLRLRLDGFGIPTGTSCYKTDRILKKVAGDLYALDIDMSECFGKGFRVIRVGPSNLIDEVGNQFTNPNNLEAIFEMQ